LRCHVRFHERFINGERLRCSRFYLTFIALNTKIPWYKEKKVISGKHSSVHAILYYWRTSLQPEMHKSYLHEGKEMFTDKGEDTCSNNCTYFYFTHRNSTRNIFFLSKICLVFLSHWHCKGHIATFQLHLFWNSPRAPSRVI
jgi:hypothetical protein